MSSSTTTPSKRRRFLTPLQQRSISTSLTPHDLTPPSTTSAISPSGLLSPSIPRSVQVSLLQVGMRTRKSIADGYKTAPKPTIIYDDTTLSSSSSSSSDKSITFADHLLAFQTATPSPPMPYDRALQHTELYFNLSAPISQQPLPSFTATTSMPPPTTRKRALSATDDAPVPDSPILSYAITSPTLSPFPSPVLRPIAQPKSRRMVPAVGAACGSWNWDAEMKIDDFGEADFLEL